MTLPIEFSEYTRNLMGGELFGKYLRALEEDAPTSIRLNPFKCPEGTTVNPAVSREVTEVPWCPSTGRYIAERPNFTFDPLLHAGLYYVQEAASMMVDLVIRQLVHQPVCMLDLCAAPGGKSTALRAALPEGSLLFSNEPMKLRAQILSENIQKFGNPDVIVTNNYPADYRKAKMEFDIILADVPCSGEGMFRKDEGAIQEWSVQNVDKCWHLQREIISDIWGCLKPGGHLIYSTCTFNAHEDEENVAWIAEELGAKFVEPDIEEGWNITGSLSGEHPVCRFIPGKTSGEGLFMAVLQKDGEADTEPWEDRKKDKKGKKGKADKKANRQPALSIPAHWLKEGQPMTPATINDCLYAIPERWRTTFDEAVKGLKVIHAGVKVGQQKGKDLIPDQSLALSTLLNKDSFPQADLAYAEAVRFLRKESVTLPEGTPCGFVLLTYRGIPLGWEKNIGNRANNLYPQEWKIKSTHIPEGDNNILTW